MTEKERLECEKIKDETKAISHNIAIKWYVVLAVTLIGGISIFKIIKDLLS